MSGSDRQLHRAARDGAAFVCWRAWLLAVIAHAIALSPAWSRAQATNGWNDSGIRPWITAGIAMGRESHSCGGCAGIAGETGGFAGEIGAGVSLPRRVRVGFEYAAWGEINFEHQSRHSRFATATVQYTSGSLPALSVKAGLGRGWHARDGSASDQSQGAALQVGANLAVPPHSHAALLIFADYLIAVTGDGRGFPDAPVAPRPYRPRVFLLGLALSLR